ncbi:hypothetical protein SLEP1_g7047 [Rubroshorea leprosula]|uniref:RNase H type-1 domain-containing protein n=1 Tax=Rubroshorea leprosula TaxID=152421 RepID=A0AAV5HXH1_9ROSI|nr:hypothetical protein SLEP1_g7047 [Rubroshorea leprosula]
MSRRNLLVPCCPTKTHYDPPPETSHGGDIAARPVSVAPAEGGGFGSTHAELRPVAFNLTDFGGVGDGVTLNTEAFERAVSAISKLGKRGGGQLNVPPGKWLTAPFNLTSHLTLFLAENAEILGIEKALRTVLQLHCGAYGTTETVAPFSIDVQNMTLRFIGSQNTSRNTQSAAEVGNKIRQLENRVSPVVWQPPQGDIIKINTDAAVPQNQNTISLGVVIRSSESKVLGAAQINCTFKGSVLQAEVMAIDFALQLVKEFGCKRVEIEYDSA